MNFFAIRYFAVKTAYQLPLFEELNERPIIPTDIFLMSFNNKDSITYYYKEYTTRIIPQTIDEQFIIGYFMKQRDAHLISITDDFIEELDIYNNYDVLLFIIDKKKQLFMCEFNPKIAHPENVKNVLSTFCEKYTKDIGYEIKLDFIVDKYKFWQILNECSGVFKIGFNLTAPNLFGGSKVANVWLSELKEIHNMTNVNFEIINEQARLRYDSDELESYRDYADSGGGSWNLKVMMGSRPRYFKSSQNIRKKDVEIASDNPKFVKNNIGSIITEIKDFIKNILNE